MAATAITCPRCKGDGHRRVKDPQGELRSVRCSTCRGTGLASWKAPMLGHVDRAERRDEP